MIRRLRESDVEPLRQIYNYYVRTSAATFETEEITYPLMRERLFMPLTKFPCLVLEEDGLVLGYCALHPYRPRFDLLAEATMYLAPEAVKAGHGTAMMERIIAEGRALPISGIIACINSENEASKRILARFGFRLVGTYPDAAVKFGRRLTDCDYLLSL